ncbi:MAG TPA: hypothetical protein VJY39_00295 [Acidisphaera sp.]|nr:hypothetical protein [Acidisphaera sp.]
MLRAIMIRAGILLRRLLPADRSGGPAVEFAVGGMLIVILLFGPMDDAKPAVMWSRAPGSQQSLA